MDHRRAAYALSTLGMSMCSSVAVTSFELISASLWEYLFCPGPGGVRSGHPPTWDSEKALPRRSLHPVSSWARDRGKGPGKRLLRPGIIREVLGSDCSFHLLCAHPLPWGGGHQEILALEESGGGAGQRGSSQDQGALSPALHPTSPFQPSPLGFS